MTQTKLAISINEGKQNITNLKTRKPAFFQMLWAGWWLKNNKPEMFIEAMSTIKQTDRDSTKRS